MSEHRDEPFYWIKSLGALTKVLPNTPAVQRAPDECSQCRGALTLSWDMHCSGTDDKGHRRSWWVAWATCPVCKLYFVRRGPPRSAEERGWQLEPDPPEFVHDRDSTNRLLNETKQTASPTPRCPVPPEAYRIPLKALGLSAPVVNCLESKSIATAGEICLRDGEELLEIRNFGERRLQEVREKLAAFGLRLQDN